VPKHTVLEEVFYVWVGLLGFSDYSKRILLYKF